MMVLQSALRASGSPSGGMQTKKKKTVSFFTDGESRQVSMEPKTSGDGDRVGGHASRPEFTRRQTTVFLTSKKVRCAVK